MKAAKTTTAVPAPPMVVAAPAAATIVPIEDEVPETVTAPVAPVQATQANVNQGMEKIMKTAEDFVAFAQGNVEAIVKSGQIWVTGVQDLSKHVAAAAQASVEESLSTFKALTSVKSLKEAFDLQANFARTTFEKTVAEGGKLTDASFKLTEQTLAPLTARVTVAVETFSKNA